MKIHLTPKQQSIVDAAVDWYFNSPDQIFQFAGNPGTGKSVVMDAIIKALKLNPNEVAPMAYVGAAAINMRLKGMFNAKTIHSWIYDIIEVPKVDLNGNIIMNPYFNRPEVTYKYIPKDLTEIRLIAIDEAGMVPLRMKEDILSRGKKILVAGDLDQLPPVADAPAFLADGNVYILDEILRQSKGSAIIDLCQQIKRGEPVHCGVYGDGKADVIVMEEHEFMPMAKELFRQADVVLCGKNSTREKYTNFIRQEVYGKHNKLPDFGEKVICRINNWTLESGGINLTNGLTGVVMNQPDVSKFDGKCFYIDFLPDLSPIPFNDIAVDYKYFIANPDERRKMKEFRHPTGEGFEFGYVQTVHLSQGSQWRNGIYFEEFLPGGNNIQLNYTALSRFSNKCIYIKKDTERYR